MALRAVINALLFVIVAIPSLALGEEAVQYKELLKPFFTGNKTVIGQEIAYPSGTPEITVGITEIAAGKETGWHQHPVPLFIYVMEGEVTLDYGEKGTKVLKAGDGILEAINWPHNGINGSGTPVRILAFYMGNDTLPNTEVSNSPQ